jgi:UDP-N-acetylmuramoyl-tripeptide--D-alanyl-D-alanine ligase
MRDWTPKQIAQAAGATLVDSSQTAGPESATLDSRAAGPGSLFIGLRGANTDGGQYAAAALEREAWGVLVTPENAEQASIAGTGTIIAAPDPLVALQRLATAWRQDLNAEVVGITGSTGKTSTKDLLLAILGPHSRTVASRANFNTEIGLPVEICNAPAETEVLVLEMGMRGPDQITELARIAEPDVGVITGIGPVHLELLGSIEAIAAAKAELIEGLPSGGTAIIPADEPLLDPHRRSDVNTITFGAGGDVQLRRADGHEIVIDLSGQTIELEVDFTQAHMRRNLLAAVAAAHAVGVTPGGKVELKLSPGRGQRTMLPGDVMLIDDCYNANPMSMRAALDDLKETAAAAGARRKVAVLGDMLELGPDERRFHREIGEYADARGVDVLVTVGPLAAAMADAFDGESYPVADAAEAAALVPEILAPGDAVLVKASRGIGLELVCRALGARDDA